MLCIFGGLVLFKMFLSAIADLNMGEYIKEKVKKNLKNKVNIKNKVKVEQIMKMLID